MATISEFDFEVKYIKGKENKVEDALSRRIQVNHLAAMRSYGTDLQDRIPRAGQQDVRYMDILHRLQQSTGIGTCTGDGTGIGIGTSDGRGTSESGQDVDYCLTGDVLVRFRDRIYVRDNNELKKMTLREFHAKPYSGHPGYHNTLTVVKRYYYW